MNSFAAGAAGNPLNGAQFRRVGIPNTFSLAWRIGRAVRQAQVGSAIGNVTEAIVAAAGGPTAARKVFTGKIHGVDTKITDSGHSLGEVIVKSLSDDEVEQGDDQGAQDDEDKWSEVRVPFMNENLAIYAKGPDGTEKVRLSLCRQSSDFRSVCTDWCNPGSRHRPRPDLYPRRLNR